MTGYGYAEEKGFRVEMRSVNHRFLDINIRMPPFLNPYEITLRKAIKDRFSRGRIDATVSLTGEADVEIRINHRFAGQLLRSLKALKGELLLDEGPSLDHLFWFRDVIFAEEHRYNPDDLINTFNTALLRLTDMRVVEGNQLVEGLMGSLDMLQGLLDSLKEVSREAHSKGYEQVRGRITAMLKDMVDEGRLLQEAAFIADRADFSEELTRYQCHVSQLRKIISEGGTIGRKADFLLQELFREVNTIGSKSNDYSVSELVVQMKSEIERIREQIQNIQ